MRYFNRSTVRKWGLVSMIIICSNSAQGRNGFIASHQFNEAMVGGKGTAMPIDPDWRQSGIPLRQSGIPLYEDTDIMLEEYLSFDENRMISHNERMITWQNNNIRFVMHHDSKILLICGFGNWGLAHEILRPNGHIKKTPLVNLFQDEVKKKIEADQELKELLIRIGFKWKEIENEEVN